MAEYAWVKRVATGKIVTVDEGVMNELCRQFDEACEELKRVSAERDRFERLLKVADQVLAGCEAKKPLEWDCADWGESDWGKP